ncbi:hypothetical protein BDQ12DRAFT_260644 [Crucibulum laeve]|uniref:Nudix hydrolase domain-containing protein n=1 Tax=Crucibulum laeve TaxID=68775 RepID=A0A5C3LDI9_9AGAR|nr:hypothetical protein BDQ12DRAFT_260644 [Crucibulum laeve]
MSTSTLPSTQYLAGDFVISAGSVLFRQVTPTACNPNGLEIYTLHTKKDEYLLPKGCKDRGESIDAAAVRETSEETGYACELWSLRMPTRATAPAVDIDDVMKVVDGLVEPIAITARDLGAKGLKLILWFVTRVKEDEEKADGTQMEGESFESVFLEAYEAVRKLTFKKDQKTTQKALEVVRGRVDGTR